MSENAKPVGLELLRQPFTPNQISKLPKPYKKDAVKGNCKECGGYHGLPAAHLDYVGHAALTDRLLDADPAWSWEPMAFDERGLPAFDASGGLWIRLTVCGVTRIGYGHAAKKEYMDIGAREKEVIGDALRNAAMRFGAALDLWHKGTLHEDAGDDSEPASATPEPKHESASVAGRVFPTLPADTQDALRTEAMEIIAFSEKKDEAGAYAYYKDFKERFTDADEQIGLWSLLDSKIRSSIKRLGDVERATHKRLGDVERATHV